MTFFIISKPKPRLCKNRACFAHSSLDVGGASYFLRHTALAFASSFDFTSCTASDISTSEIPFSLSSCAMRAAPNLDLRACKICSVNLVSDTQLSFWKSATISGISPASSSYFLATVFSFCASSATLYSRLARKSKARWRSETCGFFFSRLIP